MVVPSQIEDRIISAVKTKNPVANTDHFAKIANYTILIPNGMSPSCCFFPLSKVK